jgi:lipopolysaccharide/colanic/teichoic acid biosynthesis glycosyltransferase
VFDLLFALIALVLSLPLLIGLAFLIKLSMGGSIIFSQMRPGKHGVLFKMYKFRTMVPEDPEQKLSDKERITPLGRWLRVTSLDELPELINVVRGEMSLVGPRPLLSEYLNKYTPKQMQRHKVLPGITGLAQVRGRNELSWNNKFRYDIFYVKKLNFLLDLQILYETIRVVTNKKGFRLSGELNRFGD